MICDPVVFFCFRLIYFYSHKAQKNILKICNYKIKITLNSTIIWQLFAGTHINKELKYFCKVTNVPSSKMKED